MKKVIIVAAMLAAAVSTGCTSYNKTGLTENTKEDIALLQQQGYHDIFFTGEGHIRCSLIPRDVDFDMHAFTAISKEGHIVDGAVCNKTVYIKRTTQE